MNKTVPQIWIGSKYLLWRALRLSGIIQIMQNNQWRLLITPPANGAWNMAVDDVILQQVCNRLSPPTLRLYSWTPACLSLGYTQSHQDVNWEVLDSEGWTCVRRSTGGRAVLHTDELTYSVIAPNDLPMTSGSVLESYRKLSSALISALEILGLPVRADAEYPTPENTQKNMPVCFEVPSNYEITLHGKKLIGSAQARKQGGILQHGSLPLDGDLTRITRVLKFSDAASQQKAADRLLQHAGTVQSISGKSITWQEAAKAFETGFVREFSLSFQSIPLSSEEEKLANQIMTDKFAHESWTRRV